ncbi:hypothetical protein [Phocaeicola sartorii]|uniref:hypothetical protein n=1 Tax=Phocaeicola sartorii TaxID=671267 RepID=UPI00272B8158|nr:hypothetical protein [Phocaeicola sartorii]
MKIILEDGDKDYIKRINESLSTDNPIPVFCGKKKGYSISFDVVDIAKASAFVTYLMTPNTETVKEIEDILGVRIVSINYATGDIKLNKLKAKLQNFMYELNRI